MTPAPGGARALRAIGAAAGERGMDQTQAIREFLRMLRRRFVLLAAVAGLGMLASLAYAFVKPPVYESSATILVESQQIPDDLARSTVNLSAAERLRRIEQRLMARDNLVATIDELGLFAGLPGLTLTEKLDRAREAIQLETVAVPAEGRNTVEVFSFTITVRLDDPEQAATVADRFVASALEQNARVRADRTRTTLVFFEKEEERVAAAIRELEGEISAFKKRNEDALPESLQFRYTELTRLQETDLELDSRILELETALAGGPLGSSEPMPRSPEEAALRELALDLAQKRRVLAPNHPEIMLLQDRIAAIGELVTSYSSEAATLAAAPASPEAASRRQTELLTSRIAELREQKAGIARRRKALEASVRATSDVEIALNALVRRLGELQDQYSVIVGRRAEARTGEALEASQQSERFEVAESAVVPEGPVEPNRKQIMALGSGVSVGLALGLVLLLEMLHPAIRSSAQMERRLNLRPVITIPVVLTAWERRRRRLAWAGGLMLLVAGVSLALPLIDTHVMPLQTLAEKARVDGVLESVGVRF